MLDPRSRHVIAGIGILGLALVFVILLSTPSTLVGSSTTYVDTFATGRSGDAVPLSGFLEVGGGHGLPEGFANWTSGPDESGTGRWPGVANYYGADALAVRSYFTPGLYTPLNVFMLETRQVNVFHSLGASYRAVLGMEPIEEDAVMVPLNRSASPVRGLVPEALPMTRILVERVGGDGAVEERRLAYTFWVVEETWHSPTRATWVRAEIQVPPNGSHAAHDAVLRDFIGSLGARLFRLPDAEAEPLVAEMFMAQGLAGWMVLTTSVTVPGVVVAWGLRGGRR